MTNPKTIVIFFTFGALLSVQFVKASPSQPFSEADKAFVAKVSQGGMYEVQLGKLAESKAIAQDVRDSGSTEAHDHLLVGSKLKSIVEANEMEFPASLNAEFQSQLDKISSLPADQFDNAYIRDMKKIHAADGAAFLKEASGGSNPNLKKFAADTYRIVQRHLGELNADVRQ